MSTSRNLFVIALIFLNTSLNAQTNTFPATGNYAGLGTLSPLSWFSDKVFQIEGTRPTLRLAPSADGDLGTILLKGKFSDGDPRSADEFHLNYKSEAANPYVEFGGYKNGAKTILKIMGTGLVGIGTDTPSERLSVNGKIRAHEIKVETANWPDYVFEATYKIPSLSEIERFIKTHKRLPESPSAEELEVNGIAVGDMLKLQQKKIEELTLHLIEKEKAMTSLEKRIVEIEQKLKSN
ncbi:hypothetical protein QWY86_15470 [Pedobacter aquatilis]|uniref:hypothetical protein n=1 Tax=Pedobacter aquatilis TaxID=351343 RepID=UPI0025B2A9E6|nr:hypothetical protein [Pedobacter aquatilis]MDN3588082.1 hypothetical protein [Pedobacter aquatilis]